MGCRHRVRDRTLAAALLVVRLAGSLLAAGSTPTFTILMAVTVVIQISSVLVDANDNLYGTTSSGGACGYCVVWEITP